MRESGSFQHSKQTIAEVIQQEEEEGGDWCILAQAY